MTQVERPFENYNQQVHSPYRAEIFSAVNRVANAARLAEAVFEKNYADKSAETKAALQAVASRDQPTPIDSQNSITDARQNVSQAY